MYSSLSPLLNGVNDVIPLPLSVESPEDYRAVDTVLTFGANTPEQCVNISIRDDDVVEQTESFIVTLERPLDLNNSVSLSPTQQTITIINEDGKSTLKSYSVWYSQVCM